MRARVSHLHKTEADWNKLPNWVPEAGEIVIYDSDNNYNYVRVKIGDGKSQLSELNFFIDATIEAHIQSQRYFEVVDSGRITDYKK